ncbi:hypothetical protein GDO86_007260 [Hymenochirus boettgeri]|uniref:Uncharacterized protein n=1 Tax=Hymenochirus boettgeri TaxID=247094 RepID=A0A8T2IT09_9PIPI|nr:hypothetical protein GDO86_007260 [Hymenochirus boettgeri]
MRHNPLRDRDCVPTSIYPIDPFGDKMLPLRYSNYLSRPSHRLCLSASSLKESKKNKPQAFRMERTPCDLEIKSYQSQAELQEVAGNSCLSDLSVIHGPKGLTGALLMQREQQ